MLLILWKTFPKFLLYHLPGRKNVKCKSLGSRVHFVWSSERKGVGIPSMLKMMGCVTGSEVRDTDGYMGPCRLTINYLLLPE